MSEATIIGIDLGTTNCAVAWADRDGRGDFPIPQLTHPGMVEPRNTLPSFLYLPGPHELPAGSTELPWEKEPTRVVGWLAREQGAKVPHRVVSSAKSWLSHEGVDRRASILPWGSPDEVPRCSPVEASASFLRHIQEAWDSQNPDRPLAEQEIVLTVPASFDVVARELTAEAARSVGLKNLTLLEEPQAAFYSWLDGVGEDWRKQVSLGDRILVCDIGGGTTDFSLILVTEEDGDLALERVAVGDHILSGGDNMDLTLAATVQQRLKTQGTKLDSWQMQVLTHGCRVGKEQLLQEEADESWPVTIPGRGSSLIGGALRAELKRSEVETVLVDGFFPICRPSEAAMRGRRTGLTELGLPFEADPAVTRHLARFLSAHRGAVPVQKDWTFLHPTAILFNGGVLKAPVLRRRLTQVLDSWLQAEGSPPIKTLEGADLDLAVSRGASRYGLVRRGQGIRIRGGTNRSYYIGVEVPRPAIPGLPPPIKAVCVAPFGMEEGTSADLPGREFGLVVGDPVEFRFLGSTTRREDPVGETLEDWEEELEELTSLGTTLQTEAQPGTIVPVRLQSRVTEVGTLELWCLERDGQGRWKLEFEVRENPEG
ncbi:MAG: Hsp70 family protein [Candidatus Xenobium sp.]|jgi:hypothetical protein|nr:Hsp70 family protein [Burkholderiales bacterium]